MNKLLLFAFCLSAAVLAISATELPKDDGCTLCTFLVGQVESYLENNKTDTEIIADLEKFCSYIPDQTFANACQALVDEYAPMIIDYIENDETPAKVCGQIGLCNSTSTATTTTTQTSSVGSVGGTLECWACEFLVSKAEAYVANNNTESEIVSFLNKDCSDIPDKSWAATCQGLVSEYGPEIIQLLVNKEPSSTVCAQIKLCDTVTALPKSASECDLCQWAVGQAENYLESNQTQAEILGFLNHGCSILKDNGIVAACQALVSAYGSELISLAVNELTPTKACDAIKLCSSTSTHPKLSLPPIKKIGLKH